MIYLGILFYRMFYAITALPGIITSILSMKLSNQKVIKIISYNLFVIFSIVFIVFGLAKTFINYTVFTGSLLGGRPKRKSVHVSGRIFVCIIH